MPRFRYVHDTFWSGRTGRAIRGDHLAQAVAFYLMTCHHANQIGLYYMPIPILAHEIGGSIKGASKGLTRLCELGFCYYDEQSEWVFLPRMAHFQIGETLTEKDKRRQGVLNQLAGAGASPFMSAFYEIYGERFGLGDYVPPEEQPKGLARGIELANQEKVTPSKQEIKRREGEEEEKEEKEREKEREDLAVFEAWRGTLPDSSQGRVKFTEKKKAKIAARRADGYSQDDLVSAVRGWPNDSWVDRQNQNGLETLLRDGAQVEKFAALYREGRSPSEDRSVSWDGIEPVELPDWEESEE